MGDEIKLAAKTSGEVVAALAEKSGALAVPQEYASYIAARIHLRHYPALIERAMAVAVKLQAMGLPRRAFSALDEMSMRRSPSRSRARVGRPPESPDEPPATTTRSPGIQSAGPREHPT